VTASCSLTTESLNEVTRFAGDRIAVSYNRDARRRALSNQLGRTVVPKGPIRTGACTGELASATCSPFVSAISSSNAMIAALSLVGLDAWNTEPSFDHEPSVGAASFAAA
jgi:hypothetical protein